MSQIILEAYREALMTISKAHRGHSEEVWPELTDEEWDRVMEAIEGTEIGVERVFASMARSVGRVLGRIADSALSVSEPPLMEPNDGTRS